MNRVAVIFFIAYILVLAGVSAAMGEQRSFELYCTDLEAAAYYADALHHEQADVLNMILDDGMCGFFPFVATGEVKDSKRLGETGMVAEFIRFDNGLKVITVSPEGAY